MKFRVQYTTDLELVNGLDAQVFNQKEEELDLRGMWWVVMYRNKPVAYAGMKLFETPDGLMAYFHRVGVLAKFRNKGLHKRLLRKRIQVARNLEVTDIVTYTVYYNAVSNNNLMSVGFRQYHPGYAWVGTDEVVYWTKSLSQ